MMPQLFRLVVLVSLATTLHSHVAAQQLSAARVDDSGTVVSAPIVPMQWRQPVPARGSANDVEGEFEVALRLNLTPWLNREVRMYLVVEPPAIPGMRVTARWRGGGRFLGGSVQSSRRALVFQGLVTEPFLREKVHFILAADGSQISSTQAIQFHIEVESR